MQDPLKLSAAWRQLIEQYSLRKLTFDKDALPAVSGLGVQFESTLGTYLAGIWEKDLPFCLLWVSKFGPGRRVLSSTELDSSPPSWSWSSVVCGQISWQRWTADLSSEVEILEAKSFPSTSDARGVVSGGHITLRGKLFPLLVTYQKPSDERHHLQYELQHHLGQKNPGGTVCYFQPDVPLSLASPPLESGGTVYFLTLASHDSVTQGLLLRAIEGPRKATPAPPPSRQDHFKSDGVFIRIGVGALSSEADRSACSVKTVTII